MKNKVRVSTAKAVIVTVTNEYDYGKYVGYEQITNGKVDEQWFKPKDVNKTHPNAYEKSRLRFYYLPNFLSKVGNVSFQDRKYHPPVHINKMAEFHDFENLFADWRGMSGDIFQITSPHPTKVWRHCDYTDGFANDSYDLKGLKEYLSKIPWVKNLEIQEIPYYNRSEEHTQGLAFDYQLPPEIVKKFANRHYSFDFYDPEAIKKLGWKIDKFRKKQDDE